MLERHSPPVRYPLQRSRWLLRCWIGALVLSASVLLAWACWGAGFGTARVVRLGWVAVLWMLCVVVAWRALQRQPQGHLHWSGYGWVWETAQQSLPLIGAPVVVLDLQGLLVLRWVDGQGRRLRCVLEWDWAPQDWPGLRRAVYSSVYPAQNAPHGPITG